MEDFNMLMHQSVRDGGLRNPYSCTWRCCASQHKHLASILHLPRCDGSWLLSFTSPHASTWHQFCASIHQYINPSIQKLCSSHFSIASPLHTLAYHTWVSHTHLSMILRTVKKMHNGHSGASLLSIAFAISLLSHVVITSRLRHFCLRPLLDSRPGCKSGWWAGPPRPSPLQIAFVCNEPRCSMSKTHNCVC